MTASNSSGFLSLRETKDHLGLGRHSPPEYSKGYRSSRVKVKVYKKKGYRSPNKVRIPAVTQAGNLTESKARVKAAYDKKTMSVEQVHNEMAFYRSFENTLHIKGMKIVRLN